MELPRPLISNSDRAALHEIFMYTKEEMDARLQRDGGKLRLNATAMKHLRRFEKEKKSERRWAASCKGVNIEEITGTKDWFTTETEKRKEAQRAEDLKHPEEGRTKAQRRYLRRGEYLRKKDKKLEAEYLAEQEDEDMEEDGGVPVDMAPEPKSPH